MQRFAYRRLRGRIRERYQSEQNFAQKLHMGRVSLSKRLNNELDFSQNEIMSACRLLEIPMEEMPAYFFDQDVQLSELRDA